MENINSKTPAFPCIPAQDQFNRIYAPIPGWSKFEFAVLMIMTAKEQTYNTLSNKTVVRDSIALAEEFFNQINQLNNEKDNNILSVD
jgi:hypothetical protein